MTSTLQASVHSNALSGWPTLVAGIAIGALTIIVTITIAWRQRVIQLRDRDAKRVEQEILRREKAAKVARREVWRADYDAIHSQLERCEILAYHVRREGPCTAAEFESFDVATLRMDSERLAQRGVPGLRDPLFRLADCLDRLVQHVAVDESMLASGSAQGRPLDSIGVHDIQRTAILQDRAEREFAKHIATTWQALRSEWGS